MPNENDPPMIDWSKMTMIPSADQIKIIMTVILPPLIAFPIFFGWINNQQATGFLNLIYGLAPIMPFVIAGIIALRRNTRAALIERTAELPKTIVITDTKTAEDSQHPSVIDAARAAKVVNTPQMAKQMAGTEINAIQKVL